MLFERAAMFLEPTPRTTPDEWAAANRVYPETAGIPGPRNPWLTGYKVLFARMVAAGNHPRVVDVSGAQMGKTDTTLDIIGHRLDQKPAPILYVGPSKDFVSDQFEPRLMALLDEARSLKNKVIRGRRMKKTLKWVAGVKVRLGFAGSSTSLKSDPAGLAIIDEYDEMVANIKGQGDPLGLVEARGETYSDFVTAVTSTPSRGVVETEIDPESGLEFFKVGDKDEIESPIWRLWQEGTRHHFAWPCPQCDEFFVPMRKHLKWPKGSTPTEAKENAYIECPNCHGVIEEHHRAEMRARGRHVAPGQKIVDGEVVGEDNGSSTFSMWTSGLVTPFRTIGERAEALLRATISGEEDKIQTVVNAGFGELYAVGGGGDLPEWREVLKHALPYKSGTVPREAVRMVLGVDVQKRCLYYVLRAFGARATSWKVASGILYGETDQDEVWDDLRDLILTPVDGLYIEKALIDSGFRPDKPEAGSEHRVYEFCRQMSWIAQPTKGVAVAQQPYRISKIEVKPSGKKASYSINLVLVNTDYFKSLVHSRLMIPLGNHGAFYLPEDASEDYARQLVSEARVVTRGSKPEWVLRSKQNHFLDCEALCAVAGHVLNVQRIPPGTVRDWGGEEPEKPREKPRPRKDDDEPDEPTPKPSGPSSGSLRSRFSGHSRRVIRQ